MCDSCDTGLNTQRDSVSKYPASWPFVLSSLSLLQRRWFLLFILFVTLTCEKLLRSIKANPVSERTFIETCLCLGIVTVMTFVSISIKGMNQVVQCYSLDR